MRKAPNEKKTKTYRSTVLKIRHHIKSKDFFSGVSCWYIGITNNVYVRKAQHMRKDYPDMKYFRSFYVYSMHIASQIEDYFSDEGALNHKGKRGAKENSRYVYVFKGNSNFLDILFGDN